MAVCSNQVLAVWGSPSCGKTTIAAKIANYGFDTGTSDMLIKESAAKTQESK